MVIRYINVISIALITFVLYKITDIIYKDERRNKIVILFSLLFIQFPLLSTFVYGDIIGLMFVLIAVYQTLCVIKKEKNIYEKIKERQRQYIYSENDILKLIEKNNFKIVEVLDFETFKNKIKNTYRILYILKL